MLVTPRRWMLAVRDLRREALSSLANRRPAGEEERVVGRGGEGTGGQHAEHPSGNSADQQATPCPSEDSAVHPRSEGRCLLHAVLLVGGHWYWWGGRMGGGASTVEPGKGAFRGGRVSNGHQQCSEEHKAVHSGKGATQINRPPAVKAEVQVCPVGLANNQQASLVLPSHTAASSAAGWCSAGQDRVHPLPCLTHTRR